MPERIREALRRDLSLRPVEIMSITSADRRYVTRCLTAMVRRGELTREAGSDGWTRYALATATIAVSGNHEERE